MEKKFFNLSEQTINQITGYLTNRPWKEVNGILNAIYSDLNPQVQNKEESRTVKMDLAKKSEDTPNVVKEDQAQEDSKK